MVPREKAALAYRDTVRRRVDPALVEWSGAGVFQCRVFPLAPHSLHRLTIGYDVDLLRVGDDLELRLDLPDQTPATIVDLNIAASDARQVSLDAPATALTPGPSPEYGRGESRLSYRLVDPKQRPLAVRLRKPGTLMLAGNDEATGSYFATRVGLMLPETPSADRPKQAVFLVDTSLSAGPQFPLWTKLLRATLENNRDSIKEFAVLFFNVETFWWQEKFVANTPENVDALLGYADGLALEGATDLGRAFKEAASPAWSRVGFSPAPDLFLLSDGAATWGEDRWALLARPLISKSGKGPTALTPGPSPEYGRGETERTALTPGPSERALFAYRTGLAGGDPRLLAYLAEQTGGAVFSLVGEAEIAAASVAHRNRPWRLTGIEMAGGHDLLVAGRPRYVFPGQQLLVVGRLEEEREKGEKGRKGERNVSASSRRVSFYSAARHGDANHQREDGPGAYIGTGGPHVRPGGHQPVGRRVRRGGRRRAGGHGLRPALPRDGPDLLALDARIGAGLRPLQYQAGRRQLRRQGPAGRPDRGQGVAETTAAMCDPKANFLAWYRRVRESSEVHFDLPAALNVALEGLPAEAFAVTSAAAAVQAADAEGSARKRAAAMAVGHAGLRNAGRRGPAAAGGLRSRRRLAGAQFAGRGSAGRRGLSPRLGLLGHRVAAARRGLSPAAAGRRGADLRADHLPRHGPLPGADGPGRPGDRVL